jgi:hypothetical protein
VLPQWQSTLPAHRKLTPAGAREATVIPKGELRAAAS